MAMSTQASPSSPSSKQGSAWNLSPNVFGAVTALLMLATFLFDISSRVGVAAWASYVLAILTAQWWKGQRGVITVTAGCLVLTIVGGLVSVGVPDATAGLSFGVVNRVFGLIVLALVGTVCIRLDRRERALASTIAELVKEETRLRAIVSHSQNLTALVTTDGRLVAVSGPMHVVCGDAGYLQDFGGWATLQPHWPRAVGGRAVGGRGLTMTGYQGYVWDWHLLPIRDTGEAVTHVLFEAQDVSLRARAADTRLAIYRGLFSSMAEGVMLTDTDGHILEWNPAMERLVGWTRAEVVGKKPRLLKSGEHPPEFYQRMNELIYAGRTFVGEVMNRCKDGRSVTVLESITPIFDAQMRAQYFLAVMMDLTEHKLTEQKMLHMQKLEGLGVMAAGIAHDFNNLLAGMLGYAALAQDTLDKQHPARSMLEQVVKAAQKATGLTNQMLAYSGKGRFRLESVSLDRLVEEVLPLLRSSLPRHVSLFFDRTSALPAVRADPVQLQQVITNLCLNAGEAIGDQGGTITISVRAEAADDASGGDQERDEKLRPGKYVVLQVDDTGCGMDAETRRRIFDPFYSTKSFGRGLGLSAVYGIVLAHGGTIDVDSEVGRGTRFTVFLPASGSLPEPTPATAAADPPVRTERKLVLVIDDEEVVRDLAANVLGLAGYEVLKTGTGPEGLALYRERGQDVALCLVDMMMPVMNGEEVVRRLRTMNPSVKILLTSGYSDSEPSTCTAGSVSFLPKPYTPPQLIERVRSLLAG